ncbi:hypothetical protein TNCV_1856921 [Trichonephila clavipes]|nr:hypothetical protein TNCV_1856921 [Trichonephila clavipes]
MVDIDILMEIWKNRVKKIDFVLKWLSRVGSEVVPTKGKLETWARGRSCDIFEGSEFPSSDSQLVLWFHQLVKDKNDTHRLSLDFYDQPAGSDQCTWPWDHCLLSELREWRRQTGRHNGLRRPFDNRQSVSQNNHVIFSRVL